MFTTDLFDIQNGTVDTCGAKAASLTQIAGVYENIPPGFVVTTRTFEHVLSANRVKREIQRILTGLSPDTLDSLPVVSRRLGELMQEITIPQSIESEILERFDLLGAAAVAVRSSAPYEDSHAHSWAGQFDTLLDVERPGVIDAVRSCWASLFSERALFYRAHSTVPADDFRLAVLIQAMVPSEFAGVAFSLHPVSGKRDVAVIESVVGLGEALVSGKVTPSHYVLAKSDKRILTAELAASAETLRMANAPAPAVFGAAREPAVPILQEIVHVLEKLELHFGWPVDVEWASVGPELFVTQVRPVTAVSAGADAETSPSGFDRYYGESRTIISAEGSIESYLSFRSYLANECTQSLSFSEDGYLTNYFYRGDLKAAYVEGKRLLSPEEFELYLERSRKAREDFADLLADVRRTDLRQAEPKVLLSIFLRYREIFQRIYACYKASQWEYTEPAVTALKARLAEVSNDAGEVERKFVTLTRLITPDIVLRDELAALALSQLPEIRREHLECYADQFPWLFFNSFDREKCLSFLSDRFSELRREHPAEREVKAQDIEGSLAAAEREKSALLSEMNDPSATYLATMLTGLAFDRHELKAWWAGSEYLFLEFFYEIARRIELSVEDFLGSYTGSDIVAYFTTGKRLTSEVIERRKDAYIIYMSGGSCRFLDGKDARQLFNDLVGADASEPGENEIRGIAANVGVAEGRVRLVRVEGLDRLIADMKEFQDGEILVTTMTQPTMMSLARRSAALVTDEGGVTSHASIIARELGIPCVVGTKFATQVLKTGDLVKVDAGKGSVKKISP